MFQCRLVFTATSVIFRVGPETSVFIVQRLVRIFLVEAAGQRHGLAVGGVLPAPLGLLRVGEREADALLQRLGGVLQEHADPVLPEPDRLPALDGVAPSHLVDCTHGGSSTHADGRSRPSGAGAAGGEPAAGQRGVGHNVTVTHDSVVQTGARLHISTVGWQHRTVADDRRNAIVGPALTDVSVHADTWLGGTTRAAPVRSTEPVVRAHHTGGTWQHVSSVARVFVHTIVQ